MTTSKQIDIHAVLAERGQIALVWGLEDVREVAPDLTDEQCWQVLVFCERSHDANHGITWHTLAAAAEYMFDNHTASGGYGRPA